MKTDQEPLTYHHPKIRRAVVELVRRTKADPRSLRLTPGQAAHIRSQWAPKPRRRWWRR